MIILAPTKMQFTSTISGRNNDTRRKEVASTVKHQQQRTNLTNNTSSLSSYTIRLPRGLDLHNATTWSIVQQDPEYQHMNISLLVRFFLEFNMKDVILETERQMEAEAKMQRRAKENLMSILQKQQRGDQRYNSSFNTSYDCLQETHAIPSLKFSVNTTTRTRLTKLSNVDSLIRIQDMLGFPVCWLDPDIRSRVTPWSTIVRKYGNTPRIFGLDQCHAFQQSIPKLEDRWLSIAGLFHSGTNLLFELLSEHCDMRPQVVIIPTTTNLSASSSNHSQKRLQFRTARSRADKFDGVAWQVTWGKHNPAHVRKSFTRKAVPGVINVPDITKAQQLPVVIIRHPYSWMESMCYQSYSVGFVTPHGHSCPDKFTVEPRTNQSIPVKVTFGSGVEYYQSVAHLYNEWYREYVYNATFPLLVVRIEDLIHHPKVVIQQICQCAGGIFDWNLSITTDMTTLSFIHNNNETDDPSDTQLPAWAMLLGSVNEGKRGHDTSRSPGFLQAWTEPKLKLVSRVTRNFTRRVLDSDLMKLFHYQL